MTKDPVTPAAANAGRTTGTFTVTRRPFASSTAWPTCAAKPMAVAITPRTKSSEEACAISVPGTLGALPVVPAGPWIRRRRPHRAAEPPDAASAWWA